MLCRARMSLPICRECISLFLLMCWRRAISVAWLIVVLVFIITGLLCAGIKESSLAEGIITTINVVALLFIIVVGGYIGLKTGIQSSRR
ncbi:cationic amino acid transporter 2, vacuolar-like [Lactuca sativa]|uniref:cationic amino acid transporter 2, vacuolar-like n=1 Tax=Lactuca sativa TaxID=4236 RepID=UPI0022AFB896|nr:cationic amino acid transporter 2, vacuolar-like [Lactuca sativa]